MWTRCIASDAELYDLLAREQPSHPGDVRHREPLLDNRGLIYLHHGEPYQIVYGPGNPFVTDTSNATPATVMSTDLSVDSIISPSDPALECAHMAKDSLLPVGPNEAWKYWIDGQWRVLNFRGSCALGRYAATTLTSYLPVSPATAGDWLARADLTPEYHEAALQIAAFVSKFQHIVPLTCLDGVRAAVSVSRADADVAVRTDSHTPLIRRPWAAVIQAFALGNGVDQSGEGLVTFAIPIDSLHATRTANGQLMYRVMTRIVAYDRVSGRMVAVDSVREITAPRQSRSAGAPVRLVRVRARCRRLGSRHPDESGARFHRRLRPRATHQDRCRIDALVKRSGYRVCQRPRLAGAGWRQLPHQRARRVAECRHCRGLLSGERAAR